MNRNDEGYTVLASIAKDAGLHYHATADREQENINNTYRFVEDPKTQGKDRVSAAMICEEAVVSVGNTKMNGCCEHSVAGCKRGVHMKVQCNGHMGESQGGMCGDFR